MNIALTAQEYRDLLDMLHVADVVMTGHRTEEDKRTERHRALIQKLYALARTAGLDWLIRYDKNENRYFPTSEFEQSSTAHPVLDEFGEHQFWDELISRLTQRDAAQRSGGIDRFSSMGESDRRHAEAEIRRRYIAEFATNGVSNLVLVERFNSLEKAVAKTSD